MQTVLFDIDGTLLLFRGVGRAAMERAIEEVWSIPAALRGYSFAGATDGGIAHRVAPGRPREALWSRYLELLEEAVSSLENPSPLPGAATLVDALRARGARLGLLTGNLRRGALLKLGAVGLTDRFDFALSAFGEDGDARNDVARAARRRCGDGPITVIGDSLADIECARAIGARILAVATGPQPRSELEPAAPDRLEPDLTAVESLASWILSPAR